MACRCNEIARCEQEIRVLEREIAQGFNNAQNNTSLMTGVFPAITQALQDSIFVANTEKMNQRFVDTKNRQNTYVQDLQTRRSSELSRVKSRLSSYENEDRRYHEMMEQRAGR